MRFLFSCLVMLIVNGTVSVMSAAEDFPLPTVPQHYVLHFRDMQRIPRGISLPFCDDSTLKLVSHRVICREAWRHKLLEHSRNIPYSVIEWCPHFEANVAPTIMSALTDATTVDGAQHSDAFLWDLAQTGISIGWDAHACLRRGSSIFRKWHMENDAATSSQSPSQPVHIGKEGVLPPLRTMITSPFGLRPMPTWLGRGSKPIQRHNGIDIRARVGWPVVAFRAGMVLQAGSSGALGVAVVIRQDDGMTAYYGHLSKTLVEVGQHVDTGIPVGYVGCTGRTTGAHLHFGLHEADGTPIDPLPFLEHAEQVLRPKPEQIPAILDGQACSGSGPVVRGRHGLPVRINRALLKRLDAYTPPEIPAWHSRTR